MVIAVVAGAVLATVLGLITFGVQATVEPRGVPLAVAVPNGAPSPLQQAVQRITSQGGEQVSWRVTSPAEARRLLDEKAVYGVVELAPRAPVTMVLSGAVNPTGTQVAQQALTAAAQTAAPAITESGQPPQPLVVQTVHPTSAVTRTLPLAASILLWVGTLVGSVLVVAIGWRARRSTTAPLRLATAVVPLYLMSPTVASQVPEVLHPASRMLLWSWSPIRFSTEGVRSVLMLDTVPPDVRAALWVLTGMAVAGLIVLLWPARHRGPVPPAADEAAARKPVPPVPTPASAA